VSWLQVANTLAKEVLTAPGNEVSVVATDAVGALRGQGSFLGVVRC
jgi:hypothetical protein